LAGAAATRLNLGAGSGKGVGAQQLPGAAVRALVNRHGGGAAGMGDGVAGVAGGVTWGQVFPYHTSLRRWQ
jgi:hypothetical protein